jgi:hypothetical protein
LGGEAGEHVEDGTGVADVLEASERAERRDRVVDDGGAVVADVGGGCVFGHHLGEAYGAHLGGAAVAGG